MAKSIFREPEIQPSAGMLEGALGGALPLWQGLQGYIAGAFPEAESIWKHYGKAWGWSLVYQRKGKPLCYLTPGAGCLMASLSFSGKGRAAVQQTDLPDELKEAVEAAQYNTSGRMFDLDVRSGEALAVAERLLDIKART